MTDEERCLAEIARAKRDMWGAELGAIDWFNELLILRGELNVGLINPENAKVNASHTPVVHRKDIEDKKVTECGATSSFCPDLTQIPFQLLSSLADRFTYGEGKHGRDNWRQGIGDKGYALERLNHIIEHCYALAAQIDGRGKEGWIKDSPDGNVGAIAWGAAILAVTVPHIFSANEEFNADVK